MLSGNPDPADSLRFLLDQKRSTGPEIPCRIVSDAARWLKAELKGAEVTFSYGRCDGQTHDSFASFAITRRMEEGILIMEVRITELAGEPFVFANARAVGAAHLNANGFPYFGEIATDRGRHLLLHFISDFLLGNVSEPPQ